MANKEKLPDDMHMEVLLRMSLKDLKKYVLVSRKFRNDYVLRSMTKPQILLIDSIFGGAALFYSFYQENKPLLSSGKKLMRINPLELKYMISKPIRGLISIQQYTKVMVCNPGIGKFWHLPEIQEPQGAEVKTYFGYVKDVFKVLCVARSPTEPNGPSEEAKEYQVLTVGSSGKSWRSITCKDHHTPVTQGLCKEEVLYYGARSDSYIPLVMSFDLSSENFKVIELPEELEIHLGYNLVNYNGEIALVNDFYFDNGIHVDESNGNGEFKIWVRNETEGKGKWCENPNLIVIPGWKETVENKRFCFKGTIGTGELVFAPNVHDVTLDGSFSLLYYDTVKQKLRRVEIEGIAGGSFHSIHTFLDHVDSPQLL